MTCHTLWEDDSVDRLQTNRGAGTGVDVLGRHRPVAPLHDPVDEPQAEPAPVNELGLLAGTQHLPLLLGQPRSADRRRQQDPREG